MKDLARIERIVHERDAAILLADSFASLPPYDTNTKWPSNSGGVLKN